jgi:hypothetical protein
VQPAATESSPAETFRDRAAAEGPCGLIDAAVASDLAGLAVTGKEGMVGGSGTPSCVYGDPSTHAVQVIQMPANLWVDALPVALETLGAIPDDAVDPEDVQELEAAASMIEEGASIPAGEACDLFGKLAQVTGYAAGTTRILNYVQLGGKGALTGQQCLDGTFTSLVVTRPELSESDDEALGQAILTALDAIG